jgi:TolB-like protein
MQKLSIRFLAKTFLLFLFCSVLMACFSAPEPVPTPAMIDELDVAVRETSDYLNMQLPKGNKLMILNIQSDFPALSEYIIDELIANTVNDRVFTVVDRQQLNVIRAELDFQMSGEVDDETAQSLGRLAGAQTIISGAVSKIGDLYRLRVRVLNVQSAEIEGQFNRNIPESPTVIALVNSKATGYGEGSERSPSPAQSAPVVPITELALVQEKIYKIGDTGPAGGIIFYDKGNNFDGWRYLEAAPASTEGNSIQWSVHHFDANAKGAEIGNGKQNTQNIMDASYQVVVNAPAARLCDRLEYGGYDDWYLPSKNELGLMYMNLKLDGLGEFGTGYYFTSSETNTTAAWAQSFSNGTQAARIGNKGDNLQVRACRQF